MPLLKDLDWEDGSDNTPGIQQYIYMAPRSEIETLPEPVLNDSAAVTGELEDLVTITGNIIMKPGKYFRRIYVTLETGEIKCELQGERDGKSYKNSVEFLKPGSKPKVEGFRQWAKNNNFIILVPELDGQMRQIGHAGYPAGLVTNPGTSGKTSTDRKSSTFTFESVRKGPAPFYTGVIPLPPAQTPPAPVVTV